MRLKKNLLFFIAFVLWGCHQSYREDDPPKEVVENEIQSEQLRDSTLEFELAQYIEAHRKKLGEYADSIYYSVRIEETNKLIQLNFRTSAMVPIKIDPESLQLVDTSEYFVGLTKFQGSDIVIIDDHEKSGRRLYSHFNVKPILPSEHPSKSDELYTEFLWKSFVIVDDSLLVEIDSR